MDHFLCNRITNWNKARYERKYNHELFIDMLYEEFDEYTEAITMVDKLDGLADLYFISIGALWKLNVNPYQYSIRRRDTIIEDFTDQHIEEHFIGIKSQVIKIGYIISEINQATNEIDIKDKISTLSVLIIKEALSIGCTIGDFRVVINIVCDSNDTKLKYKLRDYQKGNLKGENFISPFEQLKIVAEVINERNKKV